MPWVIVNVDPEPYIAIVQQEIKCLQKNYDDLEAKCMDAIANFTELESEVLHIFFSRLIYLILLIYHQHI